MAATLWGRHGDRIAQLWRYYYVGLINTLVGYGLFSLLVWLGLNLFVAQIVAHVAGMAFNYLLLSRHVFRGTVGAIGPYVGAYAINYGISLALLAGIAAVAPSPYAAGFLALLGASMVNYMILSRFVFKR